MRWDQLPLTRRAEVTDMPHGQAFSALLRARGGDPRVDCLRTVRLRHGDLAGDLEIVQLAVSSLPVHPPQAFYIGATTRRPADGFFDVGSDRPGPGTSVAHSRLYARMLVMLEGPAADIARRETEAIRLYRGDGAPRRDPRIRNLSDAATGYDLDSEHAFLYLCYGSAAWANRAL